MDESMFNPISNESTLRCAWCMWGCTHVIDVVWFRRNREDGETFATSAGDSEFRKYDVKNQSSRRDSAAIVYECESCGRASTLHFAQHKGVTHVQGEIALSADRATSCAPDHVSCDHVYCHSCQEWNRDTGMGPNCGCAHPENPYHTEHYLCEYYGANCEAVTR